MGFVCLEEEMPNVSTQTGRTRKLEIFVCNLLCSATPSHMITLLPNDHAQDVASFRVGRTHHVFYTPAIATTYVLISVYCMYWNKADNLHKLRLQLAAVLQVPA